MSYRLVLPDQANSAAYQRAPMLPDVSRRGLGCGCAGGGLGLFESGMDLSSWGWKEIGLVLLGVYAVGSMVFTTGRGVSRVRAIPQARKQRERARLQKRLKELTKNK